MTVLKLTLNFNKAINLDRRHNSCSTTSTTVSFVSSWMRHVTKNTSSLLNISVSSVQAITWKRHFGINKAFSISSVFAGQECCVRVEGRPRKGGGGAFSNLSGLLLAYTKLKLPMCIIWACFFTWISFPSFYVLDKRIVFFSLHIWE